MKTLIPAYGRDYTKKADIVADLKADKDFKLVDFMSESYANLEDLKACGIDKVQVRYKKLTALTVIDVSKL